MTLEKWNEIYKRMLRVDALLAREIDLPIRHLIMDNEDKNKQINVLVKEIKERLENA
jgi:hypothetical protein